MSTTSIADLNLDDEQPGPERIKPETGAKALSTNIASGADVQGEITPDDLRRPYIQVVGRQSSEKLTEAFDFGDLVLNKTMLLVPVGTVLDGVIVAKIKKQFQEALPWDPSRQVRPKIYDTASQVRDAGGSTVFGDDHFYGRIATIGFIMPAPKDLKTDDLDEHFYYEYNGVHYARALFIAANTGYKLSAKEIFTALDTPVMQEKGIRFAKWEMRSMKQADARNTWFSLKLTRSGSNSDEMIEWSKSVAP